MKTKSTILIVDDDGPVLRALNETFIDEYNVILAASGEEALKIIREQPELEVVILDIKMARMDGLQTAAGIKEINPDLPIIFHTGHPGEYSEKQIEAEYHPYDYVVKDERPARLRRAVRNAIQIHSYRNRSEEIVSLARSQYRMVGKSARMQEVYRLIEKVAPTESRVIITGPTGSGKELVAMAIHNRSRRERQGIKIFNCNHKQPDLVESELFGHLKGSFTGAVEDRIGLFEYADGGTIFLDEIGDLDVTTQAKLLRAIETGQIKKIGSPDMQKVDVRVICATNKNLDEMVAAKVFREDLYYRLKGIIIELPPLSERRMDIPDLVTSFSEQYYLENGNCFKVFEPAAMELLIEYDWPGNVRQLLHAVQSLIDLSISSYITRDNVEEYLNFGISEEINDQSFNLQLNHARKKIIARALYRSGNNISAAARMLSLDPSNLRKMIIELKIQSG
nr:sigma-54-dependent Fis family transcriptional regulator [candidate division Zixibacteria bacterium]